MIHTRLDSLNGFAQKVRPSQSNIRFNLFGTNGNRGDVPNDMQIALAVVDYAANNHNKFCVFELQSLFVSAFLNLLRHEYTQAESNNYNDIKDVILYKLELILEKLLLTNKEYSPDNCKKMAQLVTDAYGSEFFGSKLKKVNKKLFEFLFDILGFKIPQYEQFLLNNKCLQRDLFDKYYKDANPKYMKFNHDDEHIAEKIKDFAKRFNSIVIKDSEGVQGMGNTFISSKDYGTLDDVIIKMESFVEYNIEEVLEIKNDSNQFFQNRALIYATPKGTSIMPIFEKPGKDVDSHKNESNDVKIDLHKLFMANNYEENITKLLGAEQLAKTGNAILNWHAEDEAKDCFIDHDKLYLEFSEQYKLANILEVLDSSLIDPEAISDRLKFKLQQVLIEKDLSINDYHELIIKLWVNNLLTKCAIKNNKQINNPNPDISFARPVLLLTLLHMFYTHLNIPSKYWFKLAVLTHPNYKVMFKDCLQSFVAFAVDKGYGNLIDCVELKHELINNNPADLLIEVLFYVFN